MILILEDDPGLRGLISDELKDHGFSLKTASTCHSARLALRETNFDLVISDLILPDGLGTELIEEVKNTHNPPSFILITAFGTIEQAVEALKLGADDFLTKPFNLEHFVHAIKKSLDHRNLKNQANIFQKLSGEDNFCGIIGRSRPMQKIFDQIRNIAHSSAPVIINGESGTGKELVANAIHQTSNRRNKPFIAINCASIPNELWESEFFGHAQGSFTGANKDKQGLFSAAEGGTLFLDEISELPQNMQAKLLRVLQEGVIRRVGETNERKINVRLVSATNYELERAVEEGGFRKDLYYRLETFNIYIPPLRDRKEDISLITQSFFKSHQRKFFQKIQREAMDLIESYDFPGNVRELQNLLEHAITYANGETITTEHLPEKIKTFKTKIKPENNHYDFFQILENSILTLSEVERLYTEYALKKLNYNKRRAASALGIGRRTLYRRISESVECYNKMENKER